MQKKKVYDIDIGWEEKIILESYEIVALQMAGVPDDHIVSMRPELSITEGKIDSLYGKDTYAKYESYKNEAKKVLERFWNENTKDTLTNLARTSKAMCWVEASATMTWAFNKLGAVPVPCLMVKNLLDYSKGQTNTHSLIIPSTGGIRFMHSEQVLPNLSAWKTIFLLPSHELYDKVRELLNNTSTEMKSDQDADRIITSYYGNTFEPQIYEQFPQWRENISRARDFLKGEHIETIKEERKILLIKEAGFFLDDFPELILHEIPQEYL